MFAREIEISTDESFFYTQEKGYGIIDVKEVQNACRTDSEAALKCGGWNQRRLVEDNAECDFDSQKGFSEDDFPEDCNKKRNVTVVRIDVPEFGTYKVAVSLHSSEFDIEKLKVFAGRRNMIISNASVKKDEDFKTTFYQAVTPYIPAVCAERNNDRGLFVSFSAIEGRGVKVSVCVEREEVPVIWIAGDSTLTDQNAGIPYYPYGSCAGWAQTLARYIKNAAVCNLAHSGMTTNCFRDDGHFDIVKELIKPGDFFIMQFGHNDQKRRNLEAFGGFSDNLEKYVCEVRKYEAVPIICTPISRIPLALSSAEAKQYDLPDVGYYSLLNSYAKACKDVGKRLGVLVIDLHRFTFDKWINDIEAARDYFMSGDITHTNEYGAVLIADYFISEMRKIEHNDAIRFEEYDNGAKEKALLPDMDTKKLPKELPGKNLFELEPPYVDIKGIPEYEGIRKAYRYGLLDPCVMYLHPYDPMPRGQLLMVMFNAFRMTGTRPYRKKFSDIQFDEWISGYVQTMIDEGFLDPEMKCFRPDDPLTVGEFAKFLVIRVDKNIKPAATRAQAEYTEAICVKRAIEYGFFDEKLSDPWRIINRAKVYMALANYMDFVGNSKEKLPGDAEVHPVH